LESIDLRRRHIAMAHQSCRFCRCHDDHTSIVEWSFSLEQLAGGASQGCLWCKLLIDSAKMFEDRWSHLTDIETCQVRLTIYRAIIQTASKPRLFLQWPSKTCQYLAENEVEVMCEEFMEEVNLSKIEIEFAFEQFIPEVSLYLL
jgi:hypothetical protein